MPRTGGELLPIDLWFEFASTYSYLAACRAEELVRAAGLDLRWRPFLLGPIFQAQGWNDSPFNIYPAKGRYMWRDMERQCYAAGMSFRRPTQFPRSGLLAARVALLGAAEIWCPEFVRRVYQLNFAEDRDIADEGVIVELLDSMGLDGQAICARSRSPENKERLRQQTDEAMRLGIFGAPTFVVGGELFWGNDRLEHALAWALRGPGPAAAE
jgi:2-hydroxychromene-2-carboxylate isomerase